MTAEIRNTPSVDRLETRDPNDLTLGGFVDRDTMRFVREYPHSPALVWAALTTPEQLTTWLWPCKSFEAKVGGQSVFELDAGEFSLRITEFEPSRTLSLSGLIHFSLATHGRGCRLTVTLKRPPDGWSPMGLAGFHGWLGRLGRLLAGTPADETERWAGDIWESHFAHYEREVRHYVADGAKVIWRIHFEENAPELTTEAASQLDDLARLLGERPDLAVTIDGFGDDPCDAAQSLRLCQARVEAASKHLHTAGVAKDRINIGFVLGNYHYLVARDSAAARAFNRRSELRPVY